MPNLGSLKSSIDELMSRGQTVCLWFSGGADSRLLLETMLESGKPFGILRFEDGWTREQKRYVDKIILGHNLQVLSYPALAHTLVAEDGEISLVSGYPIDVVGRSHLVVRDLVHDDRRCAMDLMLVKPKMLASPAEFDVHVVGTRGDDRHWILRDVPLGSAEWSNGNKTFISPLWEWSREDVTAAMKSLGVEPALIDTGNIECCSNCLKDVRAYCPKVGRDIDGVQWDSAGNVEKVRRICSEKV